MEAAVLTVYLIMSFYKGGAVSIPFPTMEACEKAAAELYKREQWSDGTASATTYCVDTPTGKVSRPRYK